MTVTFQNCAAQGDMIIRRIDKLPAGLKETNPEDGNFIVAHSETGHNHVVKSAPGIKYYANDNDPFIAYLVVDNTECFVEHKRNFDTHETIKVPPGIFEIRRQREHTPEGYRRVMD